MATDTDICNSALFKLGANRILSLNDDTVEGRACKEQYPKIKRAFLRSHPWNFATKRMVFGQSPSSPVYEFDYQYLWPNDCLRVLGMEGEKTFPWKVEGRTIVTNNPEGYTKYISDVHEGLFDDTALEALATALAFDLCIPLTQSGTLKESLNRDYKEKLRDARVFDAQESVGDRVYADSWLNSRA